MGAHVVTRGAGPPEDSRYVCGHSTEELERLEAQGAFFEEITRDLLVAAGLAPGMRVLDIGCGAGDVTFLAAELVGPAGAVVGIDRAPEAVEAARARAAARGLKQVTIQLGELAEWGSPDRADAVVGRFVLMHQADPAAALREAARHVCPGGVMAMLESHMDACVAGLHSWPHSPTYDGMVRALVGVIRAAGAHTDMGLRLRQTFVDAGLPAPALRVAARIEGGPNAAIYHYMTSSLRSMLPLARRLDVAAPVASEDQLEELERRLRDEVTANGGVVTSPLVVGAWCRLPD